MPNDKTDKQLVWETLKAIEDITSEYNPTFAMLPDESVWKDYSKQDKLRIRALLLNNQIAYVLDNQQWAFKLTAKGMMLKESDIKNNGTLKKKYNAELIRGVIIAIISALLGLATATIQANYLTEHQPKLLVLPKIQLVHDTVWTDNHLTKKP